MQLIECNLCHNKNHRLIFKGYDRMHHVDRKLFDVVKCLKCQLVYLNPQPTAEELKKYYPDGYSPHTGQESDFKYGYISKLLKKIFNVHKEDKITDNSKDNSVINYLDFGCGGGFHLERVRRSHRNWNLYGLDNSKVACHAVAEKGFKIFCDQAEESQLPENLFDKVYISHTIEHLSDPSHTLKRINKTMKKKSELIIHTPNFDSLGARIFKSYWSALDTPRHLYLFTPKTITRLLQKTGFQIKKITFKENPNVDIKSLYYLLHKKDLRINPIIWRIFKPISKILSKLHKSSIISVYAQKI